MTLVPVIDHRGLKMQKCVILLVLFVSLCAYQGGGAVLLAVARRRAATDAAWLMIYHL